MLILNYIFCAFTFTQKLSTTNSVSDTVSPPLASAAVHKSSMIGNQCKGSRRAYTQLRQQRTCLYTAAGIGSGPNLAWVIVNRQLGKCSFGLWWSLCGSLLEATYFTFLRRESGICANMRRPPKNHATHSLADGILDDQFQFENFQESMTVMKRIGLIRS